MSRCLTCDHSLFGTRNSAPYHLHMVAGPGRDGNEIIRGATTWKGVQIHAAGMTENRRLELLDAVSHAKKASSGLKRPQEDYADGEEHPPARKARVEALCSPVQGDLGRQEQASKDRSETEGLISAERCRSSSGKLSSLDSTWRKHTVSGT